MSSVSTADIAALTAWCEGRLVFQRQTLGEAVAQIARYHAVEFVFDDPTLGRLKVSGTLKTDDLRLFLSTLEATYPLKATVSDRCLIVSDRASPVVAQGAGSMIGAQHQLSEVMRCTGLTCLTQRED